MQAIGIHIDGSIQRRALIRKEGKNFVIRGVQTADRGKALSGETPSMAVVSGLSSNEVLIQPFTFTGRKSKKLRQAYLMQSHARLHLKEEDLISALLFNEKCKKVIAYATTQQALSAHLNKLEQFGQDPDRVTAIPEALRSFMQWKAPELVTYLIVDFGYTTTHCVFVDEGCVRKAQALSFGVRDLEELDRARAFRLELSRVLCAFQCAGPLVLTGEDRDPYLNEPLQSCGCEERQVGLSGDEQHYAIPLGLALDYLMNRKDPLQFRVGSSISKRTLRRFGCNGIALLFLTLLCCLGLYLGGTAWMERREKQLMQCLDEKIRKDENLRRELTSTGSDIHSVVNQWMKITRRNAKDYPYINQTYSVAEIVHWLTHLSKLSLEQVRIQLVSFPQLGALHEPYVERVEIEMKMEDPLAAHQFHELLKQGEEVCDGSREIIWEEYLDRIRTSFYVKKRESCLNW